MRKTVVLALAGVLLAGCGTGGTAGSARTPSPRAGAAASPADAAASDPSAGATASAHAAPSDRQVPALDASGLQEALLAASDLPSGMHQDPSSTSTEVPAVTRGPAACTWVSRAVATSYTRGVSAIRQRAFTVGNRGPAVFEGVAALPRGAGPALAAFRAGIARCPGYRVGTGKLSNTYQVTSYHVAGVGDGQAAAALDGAFPQGENYIHIRVVVVPVGNNVVMLCTFGVFGNDISDAAFARVVRTAVRRVVEAH